MAAFSRRAYAGGGTYTTLATQFGTSDATFTISAATGWPGTPGVDFLVVFERGTPNEEKVLCSQNVSTTVTVETNGRQYDNILGGGGGSATGAVVHAAGASVYLCFGAIDIDEANQVTNLLGNGASGDLLIGGGAATLPAWSTADAAGVVDKTTAQTLSSKTISGPLLNETVVAITATGNAATVPVTAGNVKVTNNSDATLTITMATASATDGQVTTVRVYDHSSSSETISWVNTENAATAPTTSNGSTTLPKTVTFQFNAATTKFRCIQSV